MLEWNSETVTVEEMRGDGHQRELDSPPAGAVGPGAGIRPTLFVGLGGTGQRIGVHLKALFAACEGGFPDWLRLLIFDTADEPIVARLEDGRTVGLEPGTEFVNIGHVPVGRIIRHRHKQQAIAGRFGESLTRLPPTVLRHGAKQVRLLGLLALYWHFHRVEEHLQHWEKAAALFDSLIASWREQEQPFHLGRALALRAGVAYGQGDLQQAVALGHEAKELFGRLGNRRWSGLADWYL